MTKEALGISALVGSPLERVRQLSAGQEFVKDDSLAEHVGVVADVIPIGLFRRHVAGRASINTQSFAGCGFTRYREVELRHVAIAAHDI